MDTLKRARDCYVLGQYENTLKALDEGLKDSNCRSQDRLLYLDQRISILLKLKRIPDAFQDAKSMVRENRKDGRGYVRCGQLCSLNNDLAAAAKWYEHGVKNVPPTDRLHATLVTRLERTRDDIKRKLVTHNARDPFVSLPLEVVEMIVQCLSHRTLVSMTRVSKAWKTLLCSLPPLADTIEFSDATSKVSYHSFRATLRRLKRYPRKAVLENFAQPVWVPLQEHLKRWFQKNCLEYLALDHLGWPADLTPIKNNRLVVLKLIGEGTILLRQVASIIVSSPHLEELSIKGVIPLGEPSSTILWPSEYQQSSLRTLVLEAKVKRSVRLHLANLNIFPNLDTLRLTRLELGGLGEDVETSPATLTRLEFRECTFLDRPEIPPNLLELGMPKCDFLGRFGLRDKVSGLQHLEQLNLFLPMMAIQASGLLLKLAHARQLQMLQLDLGPDTWEESLFDQLDLPKLRVLRLRSQALNNIDSQALVTRLPSLERLHLENAKITGAFLAPFLRRRNSKLKVVHLLDCPNVSRDVVDFARRRGVDITFSSTPDVQGQRRVVSTF
jgi:hypothetical protein